jgi:cAMP-binding proteins - catabolite gene activator and regulatory subunit of cAMP-dependent protein kinases
MQNMDFSRCPIMGNLGNEKIGKLFKDARFKVETFDKGEVIAMQGSPCKHLYILLTGSVRTEMTTETGGLMTIENIEAVRPLASAFLFAEDNTFPVDVTATTQCRILMVPRDEVIRMFQKDGQFLENYIKFNSNKTQFLSNRLKVLNIKTIKGKLAYYIIEGLDQARESLPNTDSYRMDKNQTELAKFFGVTRPALARCISELEEAGIIELQKKVVKVKNIRALNNLLG